MIGGEKFEGEIQVDKEWHFLKLQWEIDEQACLKLPVNVKWQMHHTWQNHWINVIIDVNYLQLKLDL